MGTGTGTGKVDPQLPKGGGFPSERQSFDRNLMLRVRVFLVVKHDALLRVNSITARRIIVIAFGYGSH